MAEAGMLKDDQAAKVISALRVQLAGVSDELRDLRQGMAEVRRRAAEDTEQAVAQAVKHAQAEMLLKCPLFARDGDVEKRIKHLELDRDEAIARGDRLAAERDSLLSAQSSLAAQVRQANAKLEETSKLLAHRELDLQRLSPEPTRPSTSSVWQHQVEALQVDVRACDPKVVSPEAIATQALVQALRPYSSGDCKPGRPMSSKQALAALSSMQAKVQEEGSKRKKLEARILKDRARLDGLFALVQQQHDEIAELRTRTCAASCAGAPMDAGRTLTRQLTAPTRLPMVGGPRPAA